MTTAVGDLRLELPVLAAPMAGGPGSPGLAVAAAAAGSAGFLAGGYKTPEALAAEIATVRSATDSFGVNLFAPNPVPVDPAAYARYREAIRADAERFGAALPDRPVEDDDRWQDKLDLLLADPVPLVTFTFGIPDPAVFATLRGAGSATAQTVTSAEEAARAAEAGADLLVVQAPAAGGHSGTLTPQRVPELRPLPELVLEVRRAADLPVLATGGVAGPADVAAVLRAGARAVLAGTALMLAPEAGTSAPHRAALQQDRGGTLVTRAFTGRPARALRNAFLDAHGAAAPAGYPAVHYLTSPLRRAAAAAGDPEWIHLWAGTGHRSARPQPAADILRQLSAG